MQLGARGTLAHAPCSTLPSPPLSIAHGRQQACLRTQPTSPVLQAAAAGGKAGAAPNGGGGGGAASQQQTADLFTVIARVGAARDRGHKPLLQRMAQQPGRLLGKVKEAFAGGKLEKEKILALGMGGFASYGVISNLNYGTALTISWLGFVKTTGLSPLAPGQWKPFLAFYAGMWAVQNFVRPLRFALAVALAPTFEKVIGAISQKTGLKKGFAFGILMVCIAAATSTTLFGTIYLCGGFPGGLPSLGLS